MPSKYDKLNKVHELKNKLSELRPLNQGELKRLREEFVINNTYHSNAIEGSTLTLRETALILQEGVTIAEKPIKEHLEAIGHKDAFDYVMELTDSKTALSERVIKDIHSLVLMADRENKGIYRRVPVMIMGSEHTPPQPFLIPELMAELVLDYNEKYGAADIIELASELHLRFESIHPFIDGNGRTGRLLLNFELMKCGLLPVNIKFTDRVKYYDSFDDYRRNNSVEALASLVADYEIQELQKYISIIENE
ncbi:MAG: Fic family protein [Ruminococcus sp.]|nr:Fic family protein [Ruminococcus sp.]